VVESNGSRVRKITKDGLVSTLAGGAAQGTSDGVGAAAKFTVPQGAAVASDGTLYVADLGNHRIRRISRDGVVTTFAGSSAGYADGVGTAAKFNQPHGLALGPDGTIYVADKNNHRIRAITPDGVVKTLAGSGSPGGNDGTGASAGFNFPNGLALGPDGTLYVADNGNHRVRMIR
jgi:sugar lactone lactonase YvrE